MLLLVLASSPDPPGSGEGCSLTHLPSSVFPAPALTVGHVDARHSQQEARTREAVEDVLLKHGGPDLHAFVTAADTDKKHGGQQPGRGGAPGAAEMRERAREAAEAVHGARDAYSFSHG